MANAVQRSKSACRHRLRALRSPEVEAVGSVLAEHEEIRVLLAELATHAAKDRRGVVVVVPHAAPDPGRGAAEILHGGAGLALGVLGARRPFPAAAPRPALELCRQAAAAGTAERRLIIDVLVVLRPLRQGQRAVVGIDRGRVTRLLPLDPDAQLERVALLDVLPVDPWLAPLVHIL